MQNLLLLLLSLEGICGAGGPQEPFFLTGIFFFWLYKPPKKNITLRQISQTHWQLSPLGPGTKRVKWNTFFVYISDIYIWFFLKQNRKGCWQALRHQVSEYLLSQRRVKLSTKKPSEGSHQWNSAPICWAGSLLFKDSGHWLSFNRQHLWSAFVETSSN